MIQYRSALHSLLCLWLAVVGNSVFAQDAGELSKQDAAGDSISVQLPSADQTSPAAKFVVTVAPKSAKPGEEITVTVKATIAKGWHVNAVELPKDAMGLATTIQVTGKGLKALGDGYVASSKPETFSQDGLMYFSHSGNVTWSRKFRLGETGTNQLSGSIRFQACNDETCLPQNTLKFRFGTARKRISPSVKVEPAFAVQGEPISVELKSCDVVRPTAKVTLFGALFGSREEKVTLTGTFTHEGVEYSIYLPPDRRYRLTSTSGDTRVESNATYISVDHDRNEVLETWESVSAHLPFRVADSMVQITEIDKDSMRLTLQQVDAPLSGSIVGRKVAPFSVKTIDGQQITDKTILGKVTLLDVWAVTCHNCYEKFPTIRNMQKMYSPEKLGVVLISTDHSKDFYDSKAPAIFEKYGGSDWPSVLVYSFSGALRFGDFGFGVLIVDEEGIVRSVAPKDLEKAVEKVFKDKEK